MKLRLLPLLLVLALALAGCPDSGSPPAQPGAPPQGAGGGNVPGQPPGPPAPAPPGGDGGGKDVEVVIPESSRAPLSPLVREAALWPKEDALRPLPEKDGPSPEAIDRLREDVKRLLAPELAPPDFAKAMGVDASGKLFCKVGHPGGALPGHGLASNDMVKEKPTFAVALSWSEPVGGLDLGKTTSIVKRALVAPLGAELEREDRKKINPTPALQKPDAFGGIGLLDRAGYGVEFPFLYFWASPTRVVVILQREVHAMAPGGK